MAYITFVDEHDNVIGSGTMQESWEKGIAHRIVRVFLFNTNGDLLIQKRADHLVSLPGRWDHSAAGHVDANEKYLQAAEREMKEEIGVEGVELNERGKYYSEDTEESDKINKRFNMIYVGKWDGDVRPNPDEVSEVDWLMPGYIHGWIRKSPEDFTEGFITSFRMLYGEKDA